MSDETEDLLNEPDEDLSDEDISDEDDDQNDEDDDYDEVGSLTTLEKIAQARKIVAFMKDNPDFPQFQAELPEMAAAADKLEKSYYEMLIARQEAHEAEMTYLKKKRELQATLGAERHRALKRKRDEIHRRATMLCYKSRWQ